MGPSPLLMDLTEAIVTGHGPMNHAFSLDDLKSTLAGVRHQLHDKQVRSSLLVISLLILLATIRDGCEE